MVNMKIFNKLEKNGWGRKVNFVDENNVVLGYDMSQDCCERAGWFIAEYINTSQIPKTAKTNSEKSKGGIEEMLGF